MTRLRVALTALALAASVLLSGCGQAVPTTAAVVNGVVISESTVDDLAKAMPVITDGNGRQISAQGIRVLVVRYAVLGNVARHAAAQQNLDLGTLDRSTVTDEETLALLASPAGRRLMDDAYAWSSLQKKLVTATASGTADTSTLEAVLANESVLLNPRYGVWNAKAAATSSALSVTTGSLSELAQS